MTFLKSVLIYLVFGLTFATGFPALSLADGHDETVSVEEIPTGQPETTLGEDTAVAWDSTKKVVKKAAKTTNEKGAEVLDSTKVGVAKGADYVGEKSGQAWDATKQGASKAATATSNVASKAWNKTKEVTKKAVDYTSDKIEQVTTPGAEPAVEDKSVN